MSTQYEGYTNWETFSAFAWISNVKPTNDEARAAVARGGADALQAYVEALLTIARTAGVPRGDVPDDDGTRLHGYRAEPARIHVGAGIRSELSDDEFAAIDWDDLAGSFRAE